MRPLFRRHRAVAFALGGFCLCLPSLALELVIPEGLPAYLEPIPEPTSYVRRRADAAREGQFTFQGVTGDASRPGGGIDWRHRGPRGDREWAWLLNRHQDFVNLLAVYRETGDSRYRDAIVDQVSDWMDANPVPGSLSFSPAWRALEAARRVINSWVPVLAATDGSTEIPPRTRERMVASLVDHADYLMEHHHFGGNHLVTEMSALLLLAVVLPEHSRSPTWAAYALELLNEELEKQMLPDGVHRELSNHYQKIAGAGFQRARDFSRFLPGRPAPALPGQRLEQVWDYFARVTRPNGTGPLNNDADIELNGILIKPLATVYDRPDWIWIATQGTRGEAPVGSAGSWYPYAGHLIFRNHWGRDALWGFLDLGPHGTDHQQNDRLHLSVSIGSEDFLVDAGRYVYRDDAWSEWFRSARAHNLIRIDDADPIPPGRTMQPATPSPAVVLDDWILGAGSNRFPPPAIGRGERMHSRAVVFHPAGGWVVVDSVLGFGWMELQQRWRYHPKVSLEPIPSGLRAVRKRHTLDQIQIAGPAWDGSIAEGRAPPQIEGWYSPQYNQKFPNPVWVGRTRTAGPTTTVWWFRPRYLEDSRPPVVDGNRLTWNPGGKRSLLLEWGPDAGRELASLGPFRYRLVQFAGEGNDEPPPDH